ncbi:uncharacterized protein Z518_05491 [Rhinocladiella mackenziei CBS 650.93]|uniref:DNA replication regulator Sld3 C-terminal domain-containing protein n=1 Tax=Rhinocladiella mackenziei CBS 650.93 TaxID=1442369 RepID=A0A0D2INB8_9EURO|nr:uncharacterized protein Z518_05491 [Rhinocladiella mackenziei CBS 650.93]KIX04621.1 hypothetical protein Z518_05491 [Rhinocladiella mackenziei CBS 650.93]
MQSLSPLEREALAPAISHSLNHCTSTSTSSTKRKSDEFEADEPQSENITAVFLSGNLHVITFASVTLVARACLPLAWLDASNSFPDPIFKANILSVQEWEQRILVVRKTPNGGLYAIERVGSDTYIACALHNWVSEEWCKDAAVGKVSEAKIEKLLKGEDGIPRGRSRMTSPSSFNAVPNPPKPPRPTNQRGALARLSILNPTDSTSHETNSERPASAGTAVQPALAPSVTESLPTTPAGQPDPFDNTVSMDEIPPPAQPMQETPAVAMENPCAPDRLRTQYFEHLYTSKTSLAFYTKGPLSRARAQIRAAECPPRSISQLSEFYEQSILPIKKFDLKYKESLPKVIKELPVEQDFADAMKKKTRKKKMKLGKDCLWPEEEEFIAKWWRSRDLKSSVSPTDLTEEMRKELTDLRMREAQMQTLLILEVILLERAGARISGQPISTDPEVKVESVEGDSATILAGTPKRPSKKRDLSRELDTIVDRLCIWHTVSLDDLATTEKSQDSSHPKPIDSLRDFCNDVLLPFYSAKLPGQVKSLSRKLGGHEISPQRPKQQSRSTTLAKSSSSSAALSRSKANQPLTKRTLERVLSEDQIRRHASPPILTRSSTVPMTAAVPTLKREPSERPVSRSGLLSKSASFSNREIDLVAHSKAHEAKRRKLDRLAQQKRELEAAINALKRPNRSTVAGAFMDEVEKRQEKSIQISATPRSRRVKERAEHLEPELPPMPKSSRQGQEMTMVPSSTVKTRPRPSLSSSDSIPRSSTTKRAVISAIQETPSRGLESKTSNPLALPRLSESSATSIAATPAPKRTHFPAETDSEVPEPLVDAGLSSFQPQNHTRTASGTKSPLNLRMTRSQRPVLFTPLKKSDVNIEQVFRNAPEIPERAGRMMDRVMGGKGRGLEAGFDTRSDDLEWKTALRRGPETKITMDDGDDGDIYDKLGWNDDFDL